MGRSCAAEGWRRRRGGRAGLQLAVSPAECEARRPRRIGHAEARTPHGSCTAGRTSVLSAPSPPGRSLGSPPAAFLVVTAVPLVHAMVARPSPCRLGLPLVT